MTILDVATHAAAPRTPTDRVLSASLVLAPPLYLAADVLYAVRGWDDADAGGVHVLAAIAYAFVLLRLASWASGRPAALMLVVGVVGAAGNVAYGFNTIQVSLGGVDLLDTSGPGAIIKPLGLFFPIALLVGARIVAGVGRRWNAALVAVAAVVWPVAHIANLGWLAVLVNVLLVASLLPLATLRAGSGPRA